LIRLHHGSHIHLTPLLQWLHGYFTRTLDNCSFQIRDRLSDPSNGQPSGTKRFFRVAVDLHSTQPILSRPLGTDMYNGLNVVVIRHGKVTHFGLWK
jgi:hypothetical protein